MPEFQSGYRDVQPTPDSVIGASTGPIVAPEDFELAKPGDDTKSFADYNGSSEDAEPGADENAAEEADAETPTEPVDATETPADYSAAVDNADAEENQSE